MMFLVGLLTFCVGVLAAVFNALSDGDQEKNLLAYRMLGGVLGWISLTALVAASELGLIQWVITCVNKDELRRKWYAIAIALPLIFGFFAVSYCVQYGYAILVEKEATGFFSSLFGLILHLAFI